MSVRSRTSRCQELTILRRERDETVAVARSQIIPDGQKLLRIRHDRNLMVFLLMDNFLPSAFIWNGRRIVAAPAGDTVCGCNVAMWMTILAWDRSARRQTVSQTLVC